MQALVDSCTWNLRLTEDVTALDLVATLVDKLNYMESELSLYYL